LIEQELFRKVNTIELYLKTKGEATDSYPCLNRLIERFNHVGRERTVCVPRITPSKHFLLYVDEGLLLDCYRNLFLYEVEISYVDPETIHIDCRGEFLCC
jgi:hypothetical protein